MAERTPADILLFMIRPQPNEGFKPTPEQELAYASRVRPLLATKVPPSGFNDEEWAICRAYLSLGEAGIFGSTGNAEAQRKATLAFHSQWPELLTRLSRHMGKSWANVEGVLPVARYTVKHFDMATDEATGISTIQVEALTGERFEFDGCYPVDISMSPKSGIGDEVTFKYETEYGAQENDDAV